MLRYLANSFNSTVIELCKFYFEYYTVFRLSNSGLYSSYKHFRAKVGDKQYIVLFVTPHT